MANIKSAKKDIRKTARRTALNNGLRIQLDKVSKKVRSKTEGALNEAYSIIDKMVNKGILKQNAANRKKAQFAAKAK